MFCISRLVILGVLAATPISAASGQVFFGDAPAGRVDQTARFKKSLERQIAFLIEDMTRTCNLSETQVRALQVGGKGAIASAIEKFEKRQKAMQQAMPQLRFGAPGGAAQEETGDEGEEAEGEETEVEEDKDAEPEELLLEDVQVAVAGNLINLGGFPNGGPQGSVTNEPRWINAIKTIVSKEQKEKYDDAVKKRQAFIRKTAVAAFVAKVDQKLLLSPDQRKKLTDLVDEEFGGKLVRTVGQRNGGFAWFGGNARATAPIDRKELGSFLSKPQLEEWKETFENELNQLNGAGMVGGGVFINRAAAPIRVQINGGQ